MGDRPVLDSACPLHWSFTSFRLFFHSNIQVNKNRTFEQKRWEKHGPGGTARIEGMERSVQLGTLKGKGVWRWEAIQSQVDDSGHGDLSSHREECRVGVIADGQHAPRQKRLRSPDTQGENNYLHG